MDVSHTLEMAICVVNQLKNDSYCQGLYALRSEQFIKFNLYFSNMDLSSCLELRSSPCVASSAFLANGGGCGENNGEGIDKEEDDEVISQRPGINLVNKCCFYF